MYILQKFLIPIVTFLSVLAFLLDDTQFRIHIVIYLGMHAASHELIDELGFPIDIYLFEPCFGQILKIWLNLILTNLFMIFIFHHQSISSFNI